MTNIPCLTMEQRAELAKVVADRKRLRAEVRVARDQFFEASSNLQTKRRELLALPSDRHLQQKFGISNNTLQRAVKHEYKTVNPLDSQAAERRI